MMNHLCLVHIENESWEQKYDTLTEWNLIIFADQDLKIFTERPLWIEKCFLNLAIIGFLIWAVLGFLILTILFMWPTSETDEIATKLAILQYFNTG